LQIASIWLDAIELLKCHLSIIFQSWLELVNLKQVSESSVHKITNTRRCKFSLYH